MIWAVINQSIVKFNEIYKDISITCAAVITMVTNPTMTRIVSAISMSRAIVEAYWIGGKSNKLHYLKRYSILTKKSDLTRKNLIRLLPQFHANMEVI